MAPLSRRKFLEKTAAAAALAGMPRDAWAEDYPSRPIRLVIPYAAGGSGDQIGRPWAERMESLLGPTYVENMGGAGGAIGCLAVAQGAADGYSLLLGNGSTQVIFPLTSAQPAYDTVRDFRAIYRLITSTLVFAVHPALPVNDLQELIAYAKANPGKLSYGTPGVGTGNHLLGEMFKQQSGAADVVHIPYRGAGPATNDLIGGQIPLIIAVMSGQLLQLHQAGKLRLLAVTSEKRLGSAPGIPTVIESGAPDLFYAGWFGLFAPKATPDAIVDRIAMASRMAMADPALRETYRSQGMEPDDDSGPDKFQQLVEAELARLAPVIKAAGLKHG
jgi:tripartite-type tricarboxylate transporter receptor subunit TctC